MRINDRWILKLLVVFPVVACAVLQGQSPPRQRIEPGHKSSVSADAPSASLELKQLRSGIAVVMILVNGKDRRLVVDPGSETTAVSPEVVGITQEKLKALQQNSTVQTTGFTGHAKTVLARTSFVMGAMEFHNRIVVVQDFSAISGSLEEHVDGLLGQDMLTQFSSVTFDYKHGVLNLWK